MLAAAVSDRAHQTSQEQAPQETSGLETDTRQKGAQLARSGWAASQAGLPVARQTAVEAALSRHSGLEPGPARAWLKVARMGLKGQPSQNLEER